LQSLHRRDFRWRDLSSLLWAEAHSEVFWVAGTLTSGTCPPVYERSLHRRSASRKSREFFYKFSAGRPALAQTRTLTTIVDHTLPIRLSISESFGTNETCCAVAY